MWAVPSNVYLDINRIFRVLSQFWQWQCWLYEIKLIYSFTVAKFDGLDSARTFNYDELIDLFEDIKEATKDENNVIEMFKTYDVDGNGYIERVSGCLIIL